MIGAYTRTPHFAYPGWRRRIPGGPAGGQYHGFTHNYSVGTLIAAQDDYEARRAAGMAAHDPLGPGPRGTYRGPAEVPPAPNAGTGQTRTYRYWQTERHPGTSESPGSFPAPFVEEALEPLLDSIGLGDFQVLPDIECEHAAPPIGFHYVMNPTAEDPCDVILVRNAQGEDSAIQTDGSGATNVVAQPPPPPGPAPSQTIQAALIPPSSARPAPTVAVPSFVPDWQVSRGPGGQVTWRIGTGTSSFADWMEQSTIWSGVANKWVLLGAVGALMLARRRG